MKRNAPKTKTCILIPIKQLIDRKYKILRMVQPLQIKVMVPNIVNKPQKYKKRNIGSYHTYTKNFMVLLHLKGKPNKDRLFRILLKNYAEVVMDLFYK